MLAFLLMSQLVIAAPTKVEKLTVATLFGSSSVAMVPVWITATCIEQRTCHEANPAMSRLIGDGKGRAIVVKAGANFAAHYSLWRLTINTIDALYDARVYRELERKRVAP